MGLVVFQSVKAQDERKAQIPSTTGIYGTKHLISSSVNNSQLQRNGGVTAINVAYSDDFEGDNTVAGLTARGYTSIFNGTGTVGTTDTWFQGNVLSFAAYNGSDTSYVAANYNTVASGDIDNWLITPPANVAAGDAITFYSKATPASTFPDSIRVMYSATGAITATDPSWVELGRFKVNTANTWALSSYTAPAAGATATFAIRYAVIDGGPLGSNSDYIGIDQLDIFTPAAIDGGVSAIAGITDGCGLSATTPVSVTIANNGGAALTSVPVSFTVNGGAPVNETFTGNIAPLSSANYTFTATADLSAAGTTYTITSYTTIPSDASATNDSSSITVTNSAPADLGTAAVTMGFELTDDLTGWTIADNNADGTTWALLDNPSSAVPAHSGDWCVRRAGTGSDDNDWLFTKCIQLNTGTNYSVACFYKDFDLIAPADFDIALGTAADEASMTQNLLPLQTPVDTTWQSINQSFTVAASGVYYIGFHSSSALGTGTSSQRLDDINISIITGIKENDAANMVSVSPNPTSGLVNVFSRYNEKTSVSVYNNMGQEVASYNFSQAFKTQIDLSAFANGIYTIRLNSASQSVVNKVVLNK